MIDDVAATVAALFRTPGPGTEVAEHRAMSPHWLAALLTASLSFACAPLSPSSAGATPDAAPSPDGAHDAMPTSDGEVEPLTWTIVDTSTDDGDIVIEKVVYPSGPLSIYGQICRPAESGPHKAIVINHGGWVGLGSEWNGGACADLARNGFVALQSSYRGEDGSDGDIEICGGEVDDVLALIDLARSRPELIDPDKIGMWGGSHGGCITLRAVARHAPVAVAVAAVPPIDFSTLYAFWQDGLAGDPSPAEQLAWTALSGAVADALGGTPDEVPEVYQERSPLTHLDAIATAPMPVMVVHGGGDYFVPAAQGCALAAGFESRYVVDASGTVTDSPPEPCGDGAVEWSELPRPLSDWPTQRYWQIYSDMGHGFEGSTGPLGLADTADFLSTKLD